ncbi:MAG: TetR/AcrR family transcriptional regulator [Egibacteraceae bacterium]
MTGRRVSQSGADTRARIIEATLRTLKEEGVVGTSARAIAQTGGFNAALIFYHFGTISDLLVAAVEHNSADAITRYGQRLAGVRTLSELVEVATALYRQDAAGNVTILTQLLAASASDPELGQRLLAVFEPWIALVRDVLERVLEGTPFAGMVPSEDVAFGVTSLFLGLELVTQLGQDSTRGERLLAQLGMAAELAEGLFALGSHAEDG